MSNDPFGDSFEVKVSDMLEAIRFLLLPPAEKLRRTEFYVGSQISPPWLDDHVMAGCRQTGWIKSVPVPMTRVDGKLVPKENLESGTSISTDGKGHVFRAVVTEAGKTAAAGSDDIISKRQS